MMMSGGGICEQRAREAFTFGDSEKKRTFSSERDKNLITFLSAFIERRNESFLVIGINYIFYGSVRGCRFKLERFSFVLVSNRIVMHTPKL
jgi:hypothetical protein